MSVDPSDRIRAEDPLESTLELPQLDLEATGEDLDATARNRALPAAELPRFEAEVQQLSADVSRLRGQLEERDRQLAERSAAQSAIESELRAERDQAVARDARILELEAGALREREAAERLRAELEGQLRHARSDQLALRSASERYAERLRHLEGRRGLWEGQLRDGFAALDSEAATARAAQQELERTRAELEVLRTEHAASLQQAEQQLVALRASHDRLLEQQAADAGRVLADRVAALQTEIDSVRVSAAAAEAELKSRAGALEQELATRVAEHERLVAELRVAHDEALRLRAEEIESAAARTEADLRQRLETRTTELQAEVDSHRTRAERAEETAAGLGLRVAELEAQLRELEARTQRETAALAARAELAETRARKAQVELELRSARLQALEALAQPRGVPASPASSSPASGVPAGAESMPSIVLETGVARYLVMLDGGAENVYLLGRRTSIGRGDDNDIRVLRNSVSRHHAVILVGHGGAVIEDLKSTNGILVNRRRVERSVLRDGDIVHVGKCKFRYSERARTGSAA